MHIWCGGVSASCGGVSASCGGVNVMMWFVVVWDPVCFGGVV